MLFENLFWQIAFSILEGLSLALAFIICYGLVDALKHMMTIKDSYFTFLYVSLGLLISFIIFLPIHFTIGV